MRQQFSSEINVRVSQFAAELSEPSPFMGDDSRVPALSIQSFGYMYLADNEALPTRSGPAKVQAAAAPAPKS